MKIACIGGGPAGLYLGILIRRAAPSIDVVVHERNRPDDTFGFGVVFSDATLAHFAAADAVSHDAITKGFARWDDIEIYHPGGEVTRSSGHGFCGIERKQLLAILQTRARELGVTVEYESDVRSIESVGDADVVVAADGVGSWVRDSRAPDFGPTIDLRPNKFVWLGTTLPFKAFTFIFKATQYGMFRVHAYRYAEGASTFIVECTVDTWREAGFVNTDEDGTVALLEQLFADELAGHKLIKNRSIWRNFPTVRCRSWRAGNVVLVGDAAHTAHFSIGSGTKLAMEDSIALADAVLANARDIPSALVAYEDRRRPEVESLQAAAQASLGWFEHTERYLDMPPPQFAYHLLTRSLRVSHASIARRDPSLAWAVELVLAGRIGIVPDPDETRPLRPGAVPFAVPGLRMPNRIAVVSAQESGSARGIAGDDQLVELGAAARTGAGLVLTPPISLGTGSGIATGPGIESDDEVVAWRRIVEFIHDRTAARVGAVITAGADPAALADAARRAAFAGFDILIVDVVDADRGFAVVAVGAAWPSDRALGVRVSAAAGEDAVAVAQRALAADHTLCWIASVGDDYAAVMLSDRIRYEVGIATAVGLHSSTAVDLDALIAAGRADVVVVDRALDPKRRP